MWNFRVMRNDIDEENYYSIHEVYYNENNKPIAHSPVETPLYGESKKDLLKVFNMMQKALKKPVLEYINGVYHEVE